MVCFLYIISFLKRGIAVMRFYTTHAQFIRVAMLEYTLISMTTFGIALTMCLWHQERSGIIAISNKVARMIFSTHQILMLTISMKHGHAMFLLVLLNLMLRLSAFWLLEISNIVSIDATLRFEEYSYMHAQTMMSDEKE